MPATPEPNDEWPATSEAAAEDEAELRVTDRIITFDDAVVAIAITILALDLPVPTGGNLTNFGVLDQLRHDWQSYLAFLVSFAVIANQWSSHRRVFRYVRELSHRVARLNMLWLLTVILTPFATRLVTSGGQLGVRFTVYAVIQIIATGCLLLIAREVRVGHLLRRDAPPRARHADLIPYLALIIAFAVSIPMAFFAGGYTFIVWALAPRIGWVLRRTRAGSRLAVDEPRRENP